MSANLKSRLQIMAAAVLWTVLVPGAAAEDDFAPAPAPAAAAEPAETAVLGAAPAAPAVAVAAPAPAAAHSVSFTVHKSLSSGLDEALNEAYADLASSLSAGSFYPEPGDADQALRSASISGGTLTLEFDEERVRAQLRSQGVSAWQGLDNPILVWMADDSYSSHSLVDGSHLTAFALALNSAAEDFRLRLMYPLMDLDDVTRVNAETISSGSADTLAEASGRYGSDYILSAAVSSSDDGLLTVVWRLIDKNGSSLASASLQGINQETAATVAGDVARRLMNVAAEGGQTIAGDDSDGVRVQYPDARTADAFALGPYQGLVRVRVAGVDSLADLPAIKRALVTYGYQDTVTVVAVDQDALIFDIPTGSDPLILDGSLARSSEFSKNGPWSYFWQDGKPTELSRMGVGTVGPAAMQSPGSVSQVRLNAAEGGD